MDERISGASHARQQPAHYPPENAHMDDEYQRVLIESMKNGGVPDEDAIMQQVLEESRKQK